MKIILPGDAKLILSTLKDNGYECFCVGGCVRDSLSEKTVNDWDFTTDATPDEIEKKDPDEIVEFEIPLVFLESKYQKNLDKFVKDKGYESAELSWNKKNVKINGLSFSYEEKLSRK